VPGAQERLWRCDSIDSQSGGKAAVAEAFLR